MDEPWRRYLRFKAIHGSRGLLTRQPTAELEHNSALTAIATLRGNARLLENGDLVFFTTFLAKNWVQFTKNA